jgi:predicted SprT family Zn-dependent metalloprotease
MSEKNGCYYKPIYKPDELVGKKIGKLKIIQKLPIKLQENFQYLCLCECNRYTIVRKGNLTKKRPTQSCGKCKFSDKNKGEM